MRFIPVFYTKLYAPEKDGDAGENPVINIDTYFSLFINPKAAEKGSDRESRILTMCVSI